MPLARRLLSVSFAIGEKGKAFNDKGDNQVTLDELRMSAKIVKAGGPSMSSLNLQIWGMTLSQMNSLSTLGMIPHLTTNNTITLQAGDSENGVAVVFQGTIVNAFSDFQAQPEVAFHVEAKAGMIQAVKPIPASSYPGTTDVATIMSSLASQGGLAFENNGVTSKLPSSYYFGAVRTQIQKVAVDAGIEAIIDGGKLIIWPKGQSRGGVVPLISAATGMINYPSYSSYGIYVSTLFNKDIAFGGRVKVDSALDPANGEWVVYSLDHDLTANYPNGPWFSNIGAARPGFVVNPGRP
jgi:hypothetical protein